MGVLKLIFSAVFNFLFLIIVLLLVGLEMLCRVLELPISFKGIMHYHAGKLIDMGAGKIEKTLRKFGMEKIDSHQSDMAFNRRVFSVGVLSCPSGLCTNT